MITTMFFVLVPFLKRAPPIIIHLARNVEKGGGVLMRITLPNLKHSFICPVPVLDSGFRILDFRVFHTPIHGAGVFFVSVTTTSAVRLFQPVDAHWFCPSVVFSFF